MMEKDDGMLTRYDPSPYEFFQDDPYKSATMETYRCPHCGLKIPLFLDNINYLELYNQQVEITKMVIARYEEILETICEKSLDGQMIVEMYRADIKVLKEEVRKIAYEVLHRDEHKEELR